LHQSGLLFPLVLGHLAPGFQAFSFLFLFSLAFPRLVSTFSAQEVTWACFLSFNLNISFQHFSFVLPPPLTRLPPQFFQFTSVPNMDRERV
jgi:hypothetical protein